MHAMISTFGSYQCYWGKHLGSRIYPQFITFHNLLQMTMTYKMSAEYVDMLNLEMLNLVT